MGSGLLPQSFGDESDPASNPPAAAAMTASSGSAPTNGSQLRFRSRSFDPTTDQTVHLSFWLPANYVSGGALNIAWLSTGTTNNVIWKTAWVLIHPSSEGSPTDLDAAVFGAVTAATATAVPATAGAVKQQSLDLGLSGAHAGDNLRVMFGRDADAAGDTSTAAALWLEPWSLSVTTT
jgi:hypothetical protein